MRSREESCTCRLVTTDENALTPDARMVPVAIQDEMRTSYVTYAMSVIISRALPDVRDGLKPSQRRILVAMNDLNLGPSSGRVKVRPKSAAIPAETITRTAKARFTHARPHGPKLEHARDTGR